MYSIGIRRRGVFRVFGYKRYFVKGHRHEADLKVRTPDGREVVYPVAGRLVLTLSDDSVLVIPEIEKKEWKIYADFFDRKETQGWQSEPKNSTDQADK